MEFKKFKKSQAALEFLTTYGWAFLVILLMVGALAYFGILSPGRLLPNRCNFGAEFQCLDFNIRDGGIGAVDEFRLKLKNNVGAVVDVPDRNLITASGFAAITLSKEDGTAYADCAAPPAGSPAPINGWGVAGVRDLAWTGCDFNDLSAGEKGKVLVTIRYNTAGGGVVYARETKGEVFAAVLTNP